MQVNNRAVSTKDPSVALQNQAVKSGKPATAEQKNATTDKIAESSQQKSTEQTSTYLKVLSRLENMIQKDELPDMALESFTKAVTSRLEEASAQDKKVVLNSEEAKALEIENTDDIPELIEEGLEDEDQAEKIFALLKQPKFVELMNGKENQDPQTYNANGKSAPEKTAPGNATATPTKPPTASKPEVGANAQQAIQTLKALQSGKTGPASGQNPSITAA